MNIILCIENKFECQGFVKNPHCFYNAVMNTNYIDELNESQCAAVTYNDGRFAGDSRCGFGEDACVDL